MKINSSEISQIVTGQALIIWCEKTAGKKRDNIDTDQITPSHYCVSSDLEKLDELWKEGAFRFLLPQFKQCLQQGKNFLIVGDRFGIGSSREMSPAGLKALAADVGVELIIICGEHPGSIFVNNAINLGLYVFECSAAVADANEDDQFAFYKNEWKLINITQNKTYYSFKLKSHQQEVLAKGGIFAIGRKEFMRLPRKSAEVEWPTAEQARNMTVAEQIIWAHRVDKTTKIATGETISVYTDLTPASDGTAPFAIYTFNKIVEGYKALPLKVAIVNDHFVFTNKENDKKQMTISKNFAEKYNLRKPFYAEPGDGIFHFYFPEQGLIKPGGLYAGADSHSRAYGAYGGIGIGIGSTTAGFAWATGYIYFTPVKQRRVIFRGKLQPWTSGKDIVLSLLTSWGSAQAQGMGVEFIDPDKQLSMTYRNTIANMMAEAEAPYGIFVPDCITAQWFTERNILLTYPILAPGVDALYEVDEEFNLSEVRPLIAKPFSPNNTVDAEEFAKERVTFSKALIGSCTNGSYEDLFSAAVVFVKAQETGLNAIVKGVQLIIYPGSRLVSQQIELPDSRLYGRSIASIFREVGALIRNSWCGPCFGQGIDSLVQGERAITTFNRNWQNRMGVGGEGYLASPAVVAASALVGYMAPPAELGLKNI